jgi:hypothetical protein
MVSDSSLSNMVLPERFSWAEPLDPRIRSWMSPSAVAAMEGQGKDDMGGQTDGQYNSNGETLVSLQQDPSYSERSKTMAESHNSYTDTALNSEEHNADYKRGRDERASGNWAWPTEMVSANRHNEEGETLGSSARNSSSNIPGITEGAQDSIAESNRNPPKDELAEEILRQLESSPSDLDIAMAEYEDNTTESSPLLGDHGEEVRWADEIDTADEAFEDVPNVYYEEVETFHPFSQESSPLFPDTTAMVENQESLAGSSQMLLESDQEEEQEVGATDLLDQMLENNVPNGYDEDDGMESYSDHDSDTDTSDVSAYNLQVAEILEIEDPLSIRDPTNPHQLQFR